MGGLSLDGSPSQIKGAWAKFAERGRQGVRLRVILQREHACRVNFVLFGGIHEGNGPVKKKPTGVQAKGVYHRFLIDIAQRDGRAHHHAGDGTPLCIGQCEAIFPEVNLLTDIVAMLFGDGEDERAGKRR